MFVLPFFCSDILEFCRPVCNLPVINSVTSDSSKFLIHNENALKKVFFQIFGIGDRADYTNTPNQMLAKLLIFICNDVIVKCLARVLF